MKYRNHRAIWAGSSNLTEKIAELNKAHEEFKKMLADGWQIKSAKPKRPRIKEERQPKQVVVTLGGEWTVKMSFAEYQQRGSGLKIVMRIY